MIMNAAQDAIQHLSHIFLALFERKFAETHGGSLSQIVLLGGAGVADLFVGEFWDSSDFSSAAGGLFGLFDESTMSEAMVERNRG